MCTLESQGRRLGAAGGGRLIGTAHAGAVELGLDLLHALLQPLPFRSDDRHRDRTRVVGVVVARRVLAVDGPIAPIPSPFCELSQDLLLRLWSGVAAEPFLV